MTVEAAAMEAEEEAVEAVSFKNRWSFLDFVFFYYLLQQYASRRPRNIREI